jgi:uncharacterized protein YqeY
MRAEIKEIDTAIAALEERKKADGVTDEQRAELDKQIAKLNKDKEAITEGINKSRDLVATGSATATVITSGLPSQRSEQHIQAVSDVVKEIVMKIIDTDDLGQLCWAYLTKSNGTQSDVRKLCRSHIENHNTLLKVHYGALEEELDVLRKSKSDKDKAKKLEELSKKLETLPFPIYPFIQPNRMKK